MWQIMDKTYIKHAHQLTETAAEEDEQPHDALYSALQLNALEQANTSQSKARLRQGTNADNQLIDKQKIDA